MAKTMLINMTHAEESRVGIVTNGVLTSFEIESASREHLKGNIYMGVVQRIHPALEAAFVDIGADRDAFLPLDEICFRNLPGLTREGGNGAEGRRRLRIREVLKPGQEVLVQIAKEEFANKPPTLSTFYSLPGRYLVLLPGSDEAGISRKIEGPDRSHLRELIDKLEPPEGFGIIVRTAAGFDQGARELQRDLHYLLRLWETIQQAAGSRRAPALVYREHDVVLRNIRDYFTPDIDEIYVDNEEVYQRARSFLHDVMPGKEVVLHLYKGDKPIFSHFNVEAQIESIYKRRVPLKSGGSIVIDGTEALTAIDVNSGRSTRGSSQEETAFRTNVEAATEIARQLRLRDLGGLIVIDFIDMRNAQHIAEVEKAFCEAMREDKARHESGRISHFGLLEISRQRLRPAAAASSYTACPMCEGHGLVRTTESAALVALRKIHNRVAQGDVAGLRVSLPPDVAVYLLNQKRDDLAQLERRYDTRIQVALTAGLMPHQIEMEVRSRQEPVAKTTARVGGITAEEDVLAAADDGNGATAATATAATTAPPAAGPAPSEGEAQPHGKRRRRRRSRRRGRGRQGAPMPGEIPGAPEPQTTGNETAELATPADSTTAAALQAEQPAEAVSSATGVEESAEARQEHTAPGSVAESVQAGEEPEREDVISAAVATADVVTELSGAQGSAPVEEPEVSAPSPAEDVPASEPEVTPAETELSSLDQAAAETPETTAKPPSRRSRGGTSRRGTRGGRGSRGRKKAEPAATAQKSGAAAVQADKPAARTKKVAATKSPARRRGTTHRRTQRKPAKESRPE